MVNNKKSVVILHGIAKSNSHTKKLANFLAQNNYEVINLNYPSTKYQLEELSKIIYDEINAKINHNTKLNFVGYYMGGLLVRIILNKYKFKNLNRVVHLATPNHGSEVADFLQNNYLFKKIFGPSGQELTTNQEKIKHLLNGKIYYELGIIAGSLSFDPISSLLIPGQDDGKVSIRSTKLPGMKDHVIIKSSHLFFPSNKEVQRQTLHFLQEAKFSK